MSEGISWKYIGRYMQNNICWRKPYMCLKISLLWHKYLPIWVMLNICGHLKMPQFGAIVQNWRRPQLICSQFYKLFVLWDYTNKKVTWLSQMVSCFKKPQKTKSYFSKYFTIYKTELVLCILKTLWKHLCKGSMYIWVLNRIYLSTLDS